MFQRRFVSILLVLLAVAGLSGAVYAQLESGERGIRPIDSSGTLEVTDIHVDVGGKDAESARYAGWRLAQREGFKVLWANTNKRPRSEAPNLPDSTLDQIVSSISVEREQIGPTRYIASLGILFDRARAGELLGIQGEYRRSAPMLLIPVMITGGTATSVETRNPWQRAWAQYRTSNSTIDYVRISGLGIDPLLINEAQTRRPGRGWWRNIVDFYGAADILVAEVLVQRHSPGGPAIARFIARHGPDGEIIGGFTLRSGNGDSFPALMGEGVRRMDELFGNALAAGRLVRDPTLDIPEPPPPPVEDVVAPVVAQNSWTYQVQIVSPNLNVYNFAMAHLRTTPGVTDVALVLLSEGGTSYVNVTYRGQLGALRSSLIGRGWNVDQNGYVLRMSSGSGGPPPIQRPPPPPPEQPQPSAQPPPAGNSV